MPPSPLFCEPCAQIGIKALADYLYQPEETSLAGPMMGDPDYWSPDVNGQRFLCQEHYARLSADSQLNYVPAESDFRQSREMGRAPL